MSEDQQYLEQRKHQRFPSREGAFINLRDSSNKLGQIIDISMGGLSYQYVENGIKHGDYTLDIFLVGPDFRAESLPVHTVYDCEMKTNETPENLKVRRQGVRFKELNGIQFTLLELGLLHAADDHAEAVDSLVMSQKDPIKVTGQGAHLFKEAVLDCLAYVIRYRRV